MKALIIIPSDQDRDTVFAPVAGLPLLERLILAVRENGVREFHLVVPDTPAAYWDGIRGGAELKVDLHWYGPETLLESLLDALRYDKGPTLVFSTDMVFEQGFFNPLTKAPVHGPAALGHPQPKVGLEGMLLVRGAQVEADRVVGLLAPKETEMIIAGVYRIPGLPALLGNDMEQIDRADPDGAPLQQQVLERLQTGIEQLVQRKELKLVRPSGGYWAPLRGKGDIRPAVRGLFGTLRKSTDGFIAQKLNRPISLTMSRALIRLPIHPNSLTLFCLFVGLAAAWFVAQGGYWPQFVGALLFQFNSILDGCDGEIARLRYQTSKLGSLLDTIVDNLSTSAFIVGLVIGLWRHTGSWVYPLMAGLFLALAAIAYTLVLFFLIRYGQTASLIAFYRPLQASIDQARGFGGSLARTVSKILKHDLYVFLFFLCIILGQGWLVLAMADIGILILTCTILYLVLARREWLIAKLAADTGNYGITQGNLIRG